MSQVYTPDFDSERDSPFAHQSNKKLVRRSFWSDISGRAIVMPLTQANGFHISNHQKRASLADIRREHLINEICVRKTCNQGTEQKYEEVFST